jgi:chromosome segregation ATPase
MAAQPVGAQRAKSSMSRKGGQVYNADEQEQSDQENSDINSLSGRKATPLSIKRVDVAPVGSAIPTNVSLDTKDLLARIDKLESEKAQMEEDKLELAKAVKDLNDLLKEAKKQVHIQTKQIEDAERQGAEILAAEVVEERNKISVKRSKSIKKKNKGRKRANEVDDDEEQEENEVFAENQELKKMVENLVPEENREDTLQEARSIMMVYNAKKEDLDKEIARLNKENSLLMKSVEELKKRNDEDGGETLENLTEENRALITQIKNLKKQVTELKENRQQEQKQNLRTESRVDTTNNAENVEEKEDEEEEDRVAPRITNEVNTGPCPI